MIASFANSLWGVLTRFTSLLLVNGNISNSFKPNRGLIQGDPLSPLLFILMAEVLTRLINKEELACSIHGIKVSQNAPGISHLMYADDLLMLCRANANEATNMMKCFNTYCQWSSQQANLEKTSILFSKTIPRQIIKDILNINGFKQMGKNTIYLGNSFVLSRNKTKEFGKLKDRVQQKLEGWNKNLISKAGKITLIKAVVQAIPTYSMSTFKIPDGICKDLDAMVRRFWWESKPGSKGFLAFKSWNSIC